jgi:hypothetical protein
VVVRVFDNGTPILAATNAFNLVVNASQNLEAPVIQSVTVSNGIVTIAWSTVSGHSYGVDYSDGSLATPQWSNCVPEVLATGLTASATNAVGTGPQRFYRVYRLP